MLAMLAMLAMLRTTAWFGAPPTDVHASQRQLYEVDDLPPSREEAAEPARVFRHLPGARTSTSTHWYADGCRSADLQRIRRRRLTWMFGPHARHAIESPQARRPLSAP